MMWNNILPVLLQPSFPIYKHDHGASNLWATAWNTISYTMALAKSMDARTIMWFLVAVLIVATVMSPCLAEGTSIVVYVYLHSFLDVGGSWHYFNHGYCRFVECFKIVGCTDVSCNRMCWLHNYGDNPRTVCRSALPSPWDTCCCSKRWCRKSSWFLSTGDGSHLYLPASGRIWDQNNFIRKCYVILDCLSKIIYRFTLCNLGCVAI